MSARPAALLRIHFKCFVGIQTRWLDNDVYGHINNVIYYSYFDTAINQWIIENIHLDIADSPAIGVVVDTGCTYFESVSFPERLEVGIAVSKLGRSSVHYMVGIFRLGHDTICAQGHFTHVYVDRTSRRPIEIPSSLRAALEALMVVPTSIQSKY